jgi:hypothetical protein
MALSIPTPRIITISIKGQRAILKRSCAVCYLECHGTNPVVKFLTAAICKKLKCQTPYLQSVKKAAKLVCKGKSPNGAPQH